jgi:hypothetical protein
MQGYLRLIDPKNGVGISFYICNRVKYKPDADVPKLRPLGLATDYSNTFFFFRSSKLYARL